jgi:hypothetical protein
VIAVGLHLAAVWMMAQLASRNAVDQSVTAVGQHLDADKMMDQLVFISAAAMRCPTPQKSQFD